jgi:uncharacterized paraquat-inducible protein A
MRKSIRYIFKHSPRSQAFEPGEMITAIHNPDTVIWHCPNCESVVDESMAKCEKCGRELYWSHY